MRRLPRWILWLLCVAYALHGFVGRDPWKDVDLASFGIMRELAHSHALADWLAPSLMGHAGETAALLPYWLGAAALKLAPTAIAPELAVRLPFILMLVGMFAATWYATYYLARHASAAPVTFAFGGEASDKDYARALADGGTLALVATLGLAQFSHETAPALMQLFFVALAFYGLAALPLRAAKGSVAVLVGLAGLSLSGAPVLALVYAWVVAVSLFLPNTAHLPVPLRRHSRWLMLAASALCLLLMLTAGSDWTPPRWRLGSDHWNSLGKLLVWFTWPAWPFVLWALWRWRYQLRHPAHNRHLGLPLLMGGAPLLASIATLDQGRTLFLSLPALATLAAFALPTFRRSATALIDWFTVLFFSAWGIIIWVVWISLQTGIPDKPAANVERLAPGFHLPFQLLAFVLALAATLAWIVLARWRTARHRAALWKSLVLPAAGTTLCWILLTTLWLPGLNYGRSLAPQIDAVQEIVGQAPCVQVSGLSAAQVAAVQFHGGWPTHRTSGDDGTRCPWLIITPSVRSSARGQRLTRGWEKVGAVARPTRQDETLLVYRRERTD